MKKIMEVYQADNGFIVKKSNEVYHLFGGTEIEWDTDSVKIGNAKDAMLFLLNYFQNTIEIDYIERIKEDECAPQNHFHLKLKKEK